MENEAPRQNLKLDPKAERLFTRISKGVSVSGNFDIPDGICIEGIINGNITYGTDTDAALVVMENAAVHGDISGPRAYIVGTVRGKISVAGALICLKSAVIEGEIECGDFYAAESVKITANRFVCHRRSESILQAAPTYLQQQAASVTPLQRVA